MMKGYPKALLRVVGILLFTACGGDEASDGVPPPTVPDGLAAVMVQGVGLETPASVLHDPSADAYLVSNIHGAPLEEDGNGFISRVSPNGRVQDLRWIDGGEEGVELNAPKGMALRGDTLLVADLGCLRRFHRTTGDPAGSICPPGASFFHDVTVDEDGIVYLTDIGAATREGETVSENGAIFVISPDGRAEVRIRGRELGLPNGITATRRGVFVAGSESGSVVQLTPSGTRRVLGGSGWRLDGIVFTSDGSFAFSNRSDSTVLFVRSKDGGARGEVFTLVREVPSPGDLGYDSRRERILIPQLGLNRLLFVDLGK